MQRLGPGSILKLALGHRDRLDGGHNPSAGRAVAETLAELDERLVTPAVAGHRHAQDQGGGRLFRPFKGLARR